MNITLVWENKQRRMDVISRFYYIWPYPSNSNNSTLILLLCLPCCTRLVPLPFPLNLVADLKLRCDRRRHGAVFNTTAQHRRCFSSLPATPPLFCLILLGAHHRSQLTTGHTAVIVFTRHVEPLPVSTRHQPPPSHLLSSCLIGVFVWEGENLNPMAFDFDLFWLIKLMFYANSKSEIACWEWIL